MALCAPHATRAPAAAAPLRAVVPAVCTPPSASFSGAGSLERRERRVAVHSALREGLGRVTALPGPFQNRPLVQHHNRRSPPSRRGDALTVHASASSGGGKRISQNEFTEKAWQAVVAAPDIAKQYQQQIVETEHLMKALLEQPNGLARRIVSKAGGNPTALLDAVDAFTRRQPRVSGDSQQVLGRNLEALVGRAQEVKADMKDEFVSVEHLLSAFVDDARFGQRLLEDANLTRSKLEAAVKEVRGSNRVTDQDPEGKYEALQKYGRDLTVAAREGKLDPVIGRDDEIRRSIQILSRRTKNNPCLIGEPGVGKTAVVEGLAQRIVNNDVPQALQDKTIWALDMGALIAGAKFRGEFEDRLKAVIREVTDSNGRIILFIDEIHTVVGAGASEGSMDAGNLLKPMLGRGELRCIGATTINEFRKYIEKDPALERRFQQVMVAEPSVPDTISILRGLRERYELHHGVRISDSALVDAAVLSSRYIADRFLPDKAIDLIDESAAKLKMEITSKPLALDEIDRKVRQLEMERFSMSKALESGDKAAAARIKALDKQLNEFKKEQGKLTATWENEREEMKKLQAIKAEIDRVNLEVQNAEREYDLNRAAELKYGVLVALQKQLKQAEEALTEQADGVRMLREEVTETDIADIVSKWSGIPVSKLVASEREKLLNLADVLHRRVVGQDEAVDAVSDAIQRSRAGLSDPNRPIASFMFLGPTGVGKTELAKALASYLFNTEEALIRIDMSEYMEKHTVSRLIGAPPGYVGYDEGGQLTEAVRRRPYSVVLFDEVEKAHGDVFNVLLQVLDDGIVTDSQGRKVSFKNTIIILTSNLGSSYILDMGQKDPDSVKDMVMSIVRPISPCLLAPNAATLVRQQFRPEFINRIDEFIVFQALDRLQIAQIVRLQVKRVADRLSQRKIRLEVTEDAVEFLASRGYDPAFGARPVKRVVQQLLETAIAKALLRGDFGEEDTIVVSAPGGDKAEGLRLSHGNSRNGARSRAEAQGLTDAVLLGSAGASTDDV